MAENFYYYGFYRVAHMGSSDISATLLSLVSVFVTRNEILQNTGPAIFYMRC